MLKLITPLLLLVPVVAGASLPHEEPKAQPNLAEIAHPGANLTLFNLHLFPAGFQQGCAVTGSGLPDVVALAAVQAQISSDRFAQVCQAK